MKIDSFLFCPSPEFRTGDGSGYGYVQTLGRITLMEAGNEQAVVDEFAHRGGNAVAFIAHHDDAMRGKFFLIYIRSVEEGAEDRHLGLRQDLGKVAIEDLDPCQSTHAGLYTLRIIDICSSIGTQDVVYAKPVRYTENRAKIARVLYAIQCDDEFLLQG